MQPRGYASHPSGGGRAVVGGADLNPDRDSVRRGVQGGAGRPERLGEHA